MKFFQKFSKGRRVENTIWDMDNPDGGRASSFKELSRMEKNHFNNLYKAPSKVSITKVILMANSFPRFPDVDDSQSLMEPVFYVEL